MPLIRIYLTVCFLFLINLMLSAQDNSLIQRLGSFRLTGFTYNVTGYYDSTSNKEYAIVGSSSGVWIIDVTDPTSPQQAAYVEGLPGFDLKVWKNYLYCVTGSGGENLAKIVDISDPANPLIVDSFFSAHSIFITSNGYLFAEIPGLQIYNLNIDPLNPQLVWQDNLIGGHDVSVIDNYVYDFHGYSGTNIYQITYEPFSMTFLSTITTALITYHHSGWITEDKKYLFICDEGSRNPSPDITVWDISDPSNPEYVSQYGDPTSLIHNLYIIDNYAYTSYYNSGFVIFDISSPEDLELAARYDPNPTIGEDFNGSYGCYPFTKSGNIYISDQTGLYIFSFNKQTTNVNEDAKSPSDFVLAQNYPNPFNPSTNINFSIPEAGFVNLVVYDMLGNEIKTLANDYHSAGNYNINFNSKGLASGVYLYKLSAGNFIETKKMILAK